MIYEGWNPLKRWFFGTDTLSEGFRSSFLLTANPKYSPFDVELLFVPDLKIRTTQLNYEPCIKTPLVPAVCFPHESQDPPSWLFLIYGVWTFQKAF